MFREFLILIVVFYFLVLLQSSFLLGNVILLLVILINFFEKTKNYLGFFAALPAGFFLDIFSSRPVGFYILILLAISIFIKRIFKKYVQIPFLKEEI